MCQYIRRVVIGRLQTEAELARQNPGKLVSSDNTLSVPSLPQNPSRVDRLVVESGREHARVFRDSLILLRGERLLFFSSLYINYAVSPEYCGIIETKMMALKSGNSKNFCSQEYAMDRGKWRKLV